MVLRKFFIKEAQDFYEKNPNDAVQQWDDGKIIFDKNGEMKKLRTFVSDIKNKGKKELTEKQKAHFRFDAEDKVSTIKYLEQKDLPTANLYLQTLAQGLLELYFDLKREWTPAPKQRLKYLRVHHREMSELFDSFYGSYNFQEQLAIIESIIKHCFEN